MVGQKKLLSKFEDSNFKLPGFIVFVAPKGCGKKLLAKTLAIKFGLLYSECGVKVDDIRDVIDTAYKVKENTLYCIADADTMRSEAKNAMLKITEEPPKNAYFVMTVQDDSTLLDTIKSRAFVFYLEPYYKDDLAEYCKMKYKTDKYDKYCEIASSPYEVDLMIRYGDEFLEFVNKVIDNIAIVQSANAFKSSNMLAMKNEEDKYDLKLFFDTFTSLCLKRLIDSEDEDCIKYSYGAICTASYISKCCKLGVNKQQLYDSWVLKIRGILR